MRSVARSFLDIAQDYAWDASIFSEEEERSRLLKYIIERRLTLVERTLIILYADCHSCRELGLRLGLGKTTVAQEIGRIRNKILKDYERLKDNEHIL